MPNLVGVFHLICANRFTVVLRCYDKMPEVTSSKKGKLASAQISRDL